MHPQSGVRHKGKFLGAAQLGTRGPDGVSTGLDHLVELGLTHVHLLPTNDFASIDEAAPASANRYNWGYDPLNYSVPEGTYSTDATNPAARIRELKQLVENLHGAGLRVVLDVVYNHTGRCPAQQFRAAGARLLLPPQPRRHPEQRHRLRQRNGLRAAHGAQAHRGIRGLLGAAVPRRRLPVRPHGRARHRNHARRARGPRPAGPQHFRVRRGLDRRPLAPARCQARPQRPI